MCIHVWHACYLRMVYLQVIERLCIHVFYLPFFYLEVVNCVSSYIRVSYIPWVTESDLTKYDWRRRLGDGVSGDDQRYMSTSMYKAPVCKRLPLITMSQCLVYELKENAQLSQRDHAARCVLVFAKSRTLELGVSILRTLQVYLQPL